MISVKFLEKDNQLTQLSEENATAENDEVNTIMSDVTKESYKKGKDEEKKNETIGGQGKKHQQVVNPYNTPKKKENNETYAQVIGEIMTFFVIICFSFLFMENSAPVKLLHKFFFHNMIFLFMQKIRHSSQKSMEEEK